MKSKGYRYVIIKGIEGRINFCLERYQTGSDFFALSGQFTNGLESSGLKNWIKKELPYKSYSAISEGLKILSGEPLYSGNHICEKVKVYAREVTKSLINSYSGLQLEIPFAASGVDIYDKENEEILLFDSDRRCGCDWGEKTKGKTNRRLYKNAKNSTNRCSRITKALW